MTKDKPRTGAAVVSADHPTDGLLAQYKLLGSVIDTKWATRLDHKVARVVIDRYYPRFKNARASLSYLENATGASRTNIIDSLRRITSNRVIKVTRQGVGTRPTEYDLLFDFASGPAHVTTTSGDVDVTPCSHVDDTTTGARGDAGVTQTYLRDRSTDRSTVNRNDTTALPSAPPLAGLPPASAGSAEVSKSQKSKFDELWIAYPRKHKRSEAWAAYQKLNPDDALHSELLLSAASLASHYKTNVTETNWIKHLHTWIQKEAYLEDTPPVFRSRNTEAHEARNTVASKVDPLPAEVTMGLSRRTPIGEHRITILSAEMPDAEDAPKQRVVLLNRIENGKHKGKEFTHSFCLSSDKEDEQCHGQDVFAQLRKVTGIDEPQDIEEFNACTIQAIVTAGGKIQYEA